MLVLLEDPYIRRIGILAKLKDQKPFNSFPCFSCAAEKKTKFHLALAVVGILDFRCINRVCPAFSDLSLAWVFCVDFILSIKFLSF